MRTRTSLNVFLLEKERHFMFNMYKIYYEFHIFLMCIISAQRKIFLLVGISNLFILISMVYLTEGKFLALGNVIPSHGH